MLEIKLLEDAAEDERLPRNGCGFKAFRAFESGKLTGYCLFRFEGEGVYIAGLRTEPRDAAAADGLARAVLRYAEEAGLTNVRIEKEAELLKFAALSGAFDGESAKIEDVFAKRACRSVGGPASRNIP